MQLTVCKEMFKICDLTPPSSCASQQFERSNFRVNKQMNCTINKKFLFLKQQLSVRLCVEFGRGQ